MIDSKQFYINGQWLDPQIENNHQVINPATEAVVATISLGSSQDVDIAVSAARDAFESWSHSTIEARSLLLNRIIECYADRFDDIAEAMTMEMGVPLSFSRHAQTVSGAGHLQSTLEALQGFRFERPSLRKGSLLRDEAIGVCGLITPWNWPISQLVVKVAPAVAAGCTMVFKPSELSPLSASLFAEIMDDADCPAGVFNLVNGTGPEVGFAMSSHPGIDMISFTGSTRAGIEVTKAAAATIKRVSLELGGKSPNLCFADADLDKAVDFSLQACFANSGQSCDAPTRLLVERSIYDDMCERVANVAKWFECGDPSMPGDHLGPVVSGAQFDKIQQLIQLGIDEGARLLAGGTGRPDGIETGFYVRPTVFCDVRNDMSIAREEVFGPVLVMIPFEDEAEAVRLANDSEYGLSAYVQTSCAARANRVARQLRAGSVSVNGHSADYDVPFGGYKQSGNGRENGQFGLHEFLETKAITIA